MKRKIHILGSGNAAKRHREAIERFPSVYTITDYDEADIVDCCGIPLYNWTRALKSLAFGKDVILEKPFIEDLPELRDLIDTESYSGKRVYPVLNYRGADVDDPEMGGLVWKRDISYYSGWRGEKDAAFGGVIASHGIHFIDIAISRYGAVGAVHCVTGSNPDYNCEVETSAAITLGFSSGRTLNIGLLIDNIHPTSAPANPGWDHFFANLDSAPRLRSLYHLQKVIDACYQSTQEERWVTVS